MLCSAQQCYGSGAALLPVPELLFFYLYRTGEWFFNTGSNKEEGEGVLPEEEEGRVGNNRKKLAHYQPAAVQWFAHRFSPLRPGRS